MVSNVVDHRVGRDCSFIMRAIVILYQQLHPSLGQDSNLQKLISAPDF